MVLITLTAASANPIEWKVSLGEQAEELFPATLDCDVSGFVGAVGSM